MFTINYVDTVIDYVNWLFLFESNIKSIPYIIIFENIALIPIILMILNILKITLMLYNHNIFHAKLQCLAVERTVVMMHLYLVQTIDTQYVNFVFHAKLILFEFNLIKMFQNKWNTRNVKNKCCLLCVSIPYYLYI